MIKILKAGIFLCLAMIFNCQQEKNKSESFVEVFKKYYNTGELEYKVSMKDSLLHGVSTRFYKDGTVKNLSLIHI